MPKTMTDLFTMDPLEMTTDDIDEIIKQYRERRRAFIANPAAVKASRTGGKPKATDGLNLGIEL
jgi:hypothetical protein